MSSSGREGKCTSLAKRGGTGPSLVATYLVLSRGVPPQVAWDRIRQVRPFIRPTLSQIEQVIKLARQTVDPGLTEGT